MNRFSLLGRAYSAVLMMIMAGSVASAAPLTVADEAKMAGKWMVNGGKYQRLYEITPGRNIRIEGGSLGDRRGRMIVQPDGTYVMKLDDGSHLKLTYTAANDELIVEYYKGKKDIELGLKPMWKTEAVRKKD